MPDITVNTNGLRADIEQLSALLDKLNAVEYKAKELTFITIRDLAKFMGCSEPTAQEVFNRRDFPSCDFGKSKVAEISAVKKYFSVPRRK